MSGEKALKGIRRARQRREQAATLRSEATAELRRYCQEAQKEGVPLTRIADEAGLSRQGVYDLLAQARPSS